MKKLILVLLISIYTTATFGLSVKSFYCCDKLKSTSIAYTPTADEKCGMDVKMDKCCKTTYKFFKVKDNHYGEGNAWSLVKLFTELHFATPAFQPVAITQSSFNVAQYSNPPPLRNGIPIYLFDCVYRI